MMGIYHGSGPDEVRAASGGRYVCQLQCSLWNAQCDCESRRRCGGADRLGVRVSLY
jgi:hypothetical protein